MIALLLSALEDPSLEVEFMRIFNSYEKRIYRMALAYLSDEDDAQIVMQDTFYAFARRMNNVNYTQEAAVSTYLYKVAKNKCYKIIDKNKKHPPIIFLGTDEELIEDTGSGNFVESEAITNEIIEKLEAYVNRLPEIYRDVLSLYYISGLSAEHIAEALELRLDTAKTQLKRAKAFIREFWKKEENNAKKK